MSQKNKGINHVPGMRGRRKTNDPAPEKEPPTPGTLSALAQQWDAHLAARNYAPRTLATHRWALQSFLVWAGERGLEDPATVTRAILESFQRHLYQHRKSNGQPLSFTTQRARLGAIQRLFAWLCRNGHIPANPAADLELPRQTPQALPRGLSREEIADLLAVPDTRDPLGIRDRAILETLYATGIRRGELAALGLTDIDPTTATLHVRKGKGGKGRTLPVGEKALHWLRKYLDEVRPKLLLEPGEPALFLSGYGTGITPGHLGNWVARTVKAAGIARPGACHLLRHSCATHMLEGGADVRLVQQLLGHSKLDTTAIYTAVAIEHLRSVYAASHPSAAAPSE